VSVQEAPEIAGLFPPGVVAFETHGFRMADDLTVGERASLKGAIAARVNEFAAGRACAKAGLGTLGWSNVSIPAGDDRTPTWPQGAIGSITHIDDYCVSVVARKGALLSLGIDAEHIGRVTEDLWPILMCDSELDALAACDDSERDKFATAFFAAKEAFYKCQFAVTREWLDFKDVAVEIHGAEFDVVVLKSSAAIVRTSNRFTGRALVDGTLVICGVALG
jgi:4'-phosphopantetheinyl transferase EntD